MKKKYSSVQNNAFKFENVTQKRMKDNVLK